MSRWVRLSVSSLTNNISDLITIVSLILWILSSFCWPEIQGSSTLTRPGVCDPVNNQSTVKWSTLSTNRDSTRLNQSCRATSLAPTLAALFRVSTPPPPPPLNSSLVSGAGRRNSSGSKTAPVLIDIPALKEASDLKRPRKNVTLPILALLDLSSMESRRRSSQSDIIDSSSLLKTAQMAVAHVNARQLIPGFRLQLLVNDSKVDKNYPPTLLSLHQPPPVPAF